MQHFFQFFSINCFTILQRLSNLRQTIAFSGGPYCCLEAVTTSLSMLGPANPFLLCATHLGFFPLHLANDLYPVPKGISLSLIAMLYLSHNCDATTQVNYKAKPLIAVKLGQLCISFMETRAIAFAASSVAFCRWATCQISVTFCTSNFAANFSSHIIFKRITWYICATAKSLQSTFSSTHFQPFVSGPRFTTFRTS